AQCRIFAQIAAASIPGIDTVAITELAEHDGNVVLCPVPRQHEAAPVAGPSNGTPLPPNLNGAPMLDEQSLQFRPTITDPRQAEQKIRADAAAQKLEINAVAIKGTTAL